MNKVYLLVLASCLMALLTACSPATVEVECPPASPAQQVSTAETKRDSMTVNIYIDGTPSMQGFVSTNANTKYMEAIRILDSSASTGWVKAKKTNINYFRFGTKSEPVSRDIYLSSLKAEFYDPSNPISAVSQIDKAITSAKKDNISIIVTDLYQKGTDVTLVRNALREQYLRQGYAVGVLGIKSEFNGTIYDVGTQNTSFDYNTQGKNSSKFHPFYVIILGSYNDVTHYYEKLKIGGGEKIVNDDNFIIFYPKLISTISTLNTEQTKPSLSKGIKRVATINNGDVKVKTKNKKLVDLLTVENINSEATISYEVDYQPLPYTLELDGESINPVISTKTFDKKNNTFLVRDNSGLNEGIKLGQWSFNKKKIEFSANINTKDIPSGVHFITIDALPISTKNYKWWQDWNSKEGSLDGSKTDNLLLFLRELQSITVDLVKNQNYIIGRFCYVIQKK